MTITLTKTRILVIFGGNDGLDLSTDQSLLKNLEKKGAKITWLISSETEILTRDNLINKLSTETWDILFFAGHSYSHYDPTHQENGIISLSKHEEISVRELRTCLEEAAKNGLKLAIFNSCDGLFLAHNCASFGIPKIIFMKKPIPDPVAHDFLEAFLDKFSSENSLELSLRYSREILKDKYEQTTSEIPLPGVSWLPTLYQDPTKPDVRWQPKNNKKTWGILAISSLLLLSISGIIYTKISSSHISDYRFSNCDKILVKDNQENILIQEGTNACKYIIFTVASTKFQQYLESNKNNPEVLIYKNNIEAINHNSIKLAVVVPITNIPNIAQEILRGVAQAQQEINQKGGINGRYLHITIVDDSNDPNQSQQVAEILVKHPDIIAVIGHNASNASLAAAPIYQQGKLVMVNPTSFANGISDIGNYIFRTVPNIKYMAKTLAEYIKNKYPNTKLAICYDEQASDGVYFKDELLESFSQKGLNLSFPTCNLSEPTFNANEAITKIIESGADSLLVIPHINDLDKAYQLANANQGRLKLFGNSTLATIKTLENGQHTQGLTIVVSWTPKNPLNYAFAQQAQQFWGGDISWRTAFSYDATNVIAEGLKKGKTRDTLQKALESPQFVAKTPDGDIRFLQNGDRRSGNGIIIQVQPSSSHQTGFDFNLVPNK